MTKGSLIHQVVVAALKVVPPTSRTVSCWWRSQIRNVSCCHVIYSNQKRQQLHEEKPWKTGLLALLLHAYSYRSGCYILMYVSTVFLPLLLFYLPFTILVCFVGNKKIPLDYKWIRDNKEEVKLGAHNRALKLDHEVDRISALNTE